MELYGRFLMLIFLHSHCRLHFSSTDWTSIGGYHAQAAYSSKSLYTSTRIQVITTHLTRILVQKECHPTNLRGQITYPTAGYGNLSYPRWLCQRACLELTFLSPWSWMACSFLFLPCLVKGFFDTHPPSLPWKDSLLLFLLWPTKVLTVTLPSLPC